MIHEVRREMDKVDRVKTVSLENGAGIVFAMMVPIPRRVGNHVASFYLDMAVSQGGEAPLVFDHDAP